MTAASVAVAFAAAQDEQDAPPQERLCSVSERRKLAWSSAAARSCGGGVCGGVFEPFGLWVEAGGFALDGDLDRVAAAVQEALEGGDERFLFGRAAQLEARSVGVEEEAVAFVCELNNTVS